MHLAVESKLRIERSTQGSLILLRMTGTIDEDFAGAAAAQGIEGTLIVSLAGIRRITSFGIRQWIDFVEQASTSCGAIYFIECAPRVVDQFNMVANFGGAGLVVSFFAPARCEQCGTERVHLLHVERDWELLREHRPDLGRCPTDGSELVLDDDAESYLSYVTVQGPSELSPLVHAFLASRTAYAAPTGLRKLRVQKSVQDNYTFITLTGDIGDDFPVAKLVQGLEGHVVLDLLAVGQMSEQGRERWRQLLAAAAPATQSVSLAGVPAALLPDFEAVADPETRGQVLSVQLPYQCAGCSVSSSHELVVSEHLEQLQQDALPAQPCPECEQPASCSANEAAREALRALEHPTVDLPPAEIVRRARAPSPQSDVPWPQAPPPAPRADGRWRWLLVACAAAAGLVLGTLGLRSSEPRRRSGASRSGGEQLLQASHPRPPAWRDRRAEVSGKELRVVGSSGPARDKAQAFERAMHAAWDELAQWMVQGMPDARWQEHVAGQFVRQRTDALNELQRLLRAGGADVARRPLQQAAAARRCVFEALRAVHGSAARGSADDYYWEKRRDAAGTQYSVWARLKLAEAQIRQMRAKYQQNAEALGATAVSYFPSMCWRYDLRAAAVVTNIERDSVLRHVGLQAGDLVIWAQGRDVHSAADFRRVLSQEYGELAGRGGVMRLRVKRGDAPVVEQWLEVQQRRTGSAVKHPRPEQQRPPPANIWDDNPFE